MINCSFFYSSAGQTFAFISLEKRTSLIVFLHLVVVAMLFIHKNDRTKSNFTWQILKHDKSMGQRKIWVPDRNETHDLPNTGWMLYPLGYKKSWRARSVSWVHMWQAFCISCAVQENIHTPPTEEIGISWEEGGSARPFKEMCEA